MIRHSVSFKLKHAIDSPSAKQFLNAINNLALITGVKNLKCLPQISNKNNYDFGLFMDFDNAEDYQYYTDHHDHQIFVQQYWLEEVIDFIEMDFKLAS